MTIQDHRLAPEVPQGWGTPHLGRLVRIRNGCDHKDFEVAEGGYPVYGSGGEFARASRYLYEGHGVLLGRKGTIDRPLPVSGRFWIVDTMYFAEPGPLLNPRFLYYLAATIPFDFYSTNTALPSMTASDLSSHPVPVPPMGEQRRIADFLDDQVGRIDEIVRARRQQIDTLEQRGRMGLLAVLEGLSLDTPTGVPWLPYGNDDWHVRPLKAVARCLDRYRIPLSSEERGPMQGDFPYYGASSVVDYIDRYLFDDELVLFGEDGAALENLQAEVVQRVSGKCWVNNHTHVLAANGKADLDFLASYLSVADRRTVLSGSTRPKVTQEDLMNLRVVTPPKSTQRDLAAQVTLHRAETARLVNEMTEQVALLEERKRSLITAAVTGEFDVITTSGRGI